MATIGSWGTNLIFSTSDSRILTFSNFKRTVSSTWVTHSRIGKKDRSEFARASLQKVTFTMVLDATLGVKPRTMLETLESAVENGLVYPLVIGGKKVGQNKWKINSTSEAWDVLLAQGQLVRAKVDVTMEEYL
jgi:hypothetical protein